MVFLKAESRTSYRAEAFKGLFFEVFQQRPRTSMAPSASALAPHSGADEDGRSENRSRPVKYVTRSDPSLAQLNLDSPQHALSNGYRVWGVNVLLC